MTRYLLDANVLVALAWPQHVHHRRARGWFAGVKEWATASVTEAALIRLSMNRAVVGEPATFAEAVSLVRALRDVPGHDFIPDAATFAAPRVECTVGTAAGVTDAHLVNLAAANDSVLATLDRGIAGMLKPADRRYVFELP